MQGKEYYRFCQGVSGYQCGKQGGYVSPYEGKEYCFPDGYPAEPLESFMRNLGCRVEEGEHSAAA